MSDTESDDNESNMSNLGINSGVKPGSNHRPNNGRVQTEDTEVLASQEHGVGWKEPIQQFGGGELELLTATLDSNDLRRLGIPQGVHNVKVRIVGGVMLINPA